MADEGAEEITSDFQCFVCGAIFTTEQDRRQHLEKEAAGKLHGGATRDEINAAKKQTELSETHRQTYESP
jgi:uncharacterized C2H2 Zn-finger protein